MGKLLQRANATLEVCKTAKGKITNGIAKATSPTQNKILI